MKKISAIEFNEQMPNYLAKEEALIEYSRFSTLLTQTNNSYQNLDVFITAVKKEAGIKTKLNSRSNFIIVTRLLAAATLLGCALFVFGKI